MPETLQNILVYHRISSSREFCKVGGILPILQMRRLTGRVICQEQVRHKEEGQRRVSGPPSSPAPGKEPVTVLQRRDTELPLTAGASKSGRAQAFSAECMPWPWTCMQFEGLSGMGGFRWMPKNSNVKDKK